MAACRAVEVTTAEMTSTSESEDADLDEAVRGDLWGFLRADCAGGEFEMVMWAKVRGMRRGVADRKESSEAREVGSVADDEVEGGKNVECRALAVPPGMRAMRRLGKAASRSERAPCSAFTIS
jgi:hypothetical protein